MIASYQAGPIIYDFSMKNPFLREDKPLKYVGTAYFSQARQIGGAAVADYLSAKHRDNPLEGCPLSPEWCGR